MPDVKQILLVLLCVVGGSLALVLLMWALWWWQVRSLTRRRSWLSIAAAESGWRIAPAAVLIKDLAFAPFPILRRSPTGVDLWGPDAKADPCATIKTAREAGFVFHFDGGDCLCAVARLTADAPTMSLQIRSWLVETPDDLPKIELQRADPLFEGWWVKGDDSARVRKLLTHDICRLINEDPHILFIQTMACWLLVVRLPPESSTDYLRLWDTTAKLCRHMSRSMAPPTSFDPAP